MRCNKCGEPGMSGPKWEPLLDMLKYWCGTCGYYTHKNPADKKEPPFPLPMRKEADQE